MRIPTELLDLLYRTSLVYNTSSGNIDSVIAIVGESVLLVFSKCKDDSLGPGCWTTRPAAKGSTRGLPVQE